MSERVAPLGEPWILDTSALMALADGDVRGPIVGALLADAHTSGGEVFLAYSAYALDEVRAELGNEQADRVEHLLRVNGGHRLDPLDADRDWLGYSAKIADVPPSTVHSVMILNQLGGAIFTWDPAPARLLADNPDAVEYLGIDPETRI